MARGRAHSRPRGLPRLSEDKFGGASTRSVGKPASPAQPRGMIHCRRRLRTSRSPAAEIDAKPFFAAACVKPGGEP